jgi:predicted nucleic acid-binding Zn ribbon protein
MPTYEFLCETCGEPTAKMMPISALEETRGKQ